MIQIRLAPDARYDISEMAQMAIEGGCGWLVLSSEALAASDIRSLAENLVPLCRDSGTILTLEDDIEAVKELSAHGVLVNRGVNALAVREQLGPEAIVGTEVATSSAAVEMSRGDIDYVLLPADTNLGDVKQIVAATRACGVEIPFVAQCDVRTADFATLLEAGYAGVYATAGVFDSDDPVENISKLISAIAHS